MKVLSVNAPKPKPVPPRTFVIELTEGELDFLLGVCLAVHGDAKKSPAKYGYRIYQALYSATGLSGYNTDAWRLLNQERYGIPFKDYQSD